MKKNPSELNQIFRIDALIGCGNLLGFSEWLVQTFDDQQNPSLSLIFLDARSFSSVNDAIGHARGDAALRWIGIVLMEESGAPVYRIGGDELVLILVGAQREGHAALAQRIFERLDREAEQFGLSSPPVCMVLIHYSGEEQFSSADVMIHLGVSLFKTKKDGQPGVRTFNAGEIHPGKDTSYAQWIANLVTRRIVSFGAILDESRQLAYTDPVTGLPNMRAAQDLLKTTTEKARQEQQSFSILLIDGDDLKNYNQISYAEGDRMIQRLAESLAARLRPGDFLARWRLGDEFLILLPSADPQQAVQVGNRLCSNVQEASQSWLLPVTISIGVASFPQDGLNEVDLLERAEIANAQAKRLGKNRVVYIPNPQSDLPLQDTP